MNAVTGLLLSLLFPPKSFLCSLLIFVLKRDCSNFSSVDLLKWEIEQIGAFPFLVFTSCWIKSERTKALADQLIIKMALTTESSLQIRGSGI